MSRPLHETAPVAFPGGTMVFGLGTDCPRQPPARPSPLTVVQQGGMVVSESR